MKLTLLTTVALAATFSCATSFVTSRPQPFRTELQVSELHIPGYRQTKLPFILQEDGVCDQETLVAVPTKTYSAHDYESLIPHQDGHLLHKTRQPIFSADECDRIVAEAEQRALETQWTTNRHGNYPTTDLPLIELPETLSFLQVALVERIYPLLTAQFGEFLPDPSRLRVADGFVVKYDAQGGQTELKPHRDGSVLSFNIALNPSSEYDGGGTWVASLNDAVRLDQGEIVTHASGILHGGHGITRGKRYIMVAFVILEGYDSWSMRFYNQIRHE